MIRWVITLRCWSREAFLLPHNARLDQIRCSSAGGGKPDVSDPLIWHTSLIVTCVTGNTNASTLTGQLLRPSIGDFLPCASFAPGPSNNDSSQRIQRPVLRMFLRLRSLLAPFPTRRLMYCFYWLLDAQASKPRSFLLFCRDGYRCR